MLSLSAGRLAAAGFGLEVGGLGAGKGTEESVGKEITVGLGADLTEGGDGTLRAYESGENWKVSRLVEE